MKIVDTHGLQDVGHAAIQLSPNYVFGYYPSGGSGGTAGSGELMSSKGVPEVESRNAFDRAGYLSRGYTEYTLSVTPQQLTSLQKYFSNIVANPGNYNLLINNCTSVIISGLESVGVPLRTPTGEGIAPGFTSPSLFGSMLYMPYYMPGLVTGAQHYGGN